MANVSVDVDIDDVLWDMSSSEKEELCQQLIEDGYGPDPDPFEEVELRDILHVGTYTEGELVSLIENLWNNRTFFDINTIDNLRDSLRKQNIL